MTTQVYDGSDYTGTNTYFIIANSEEKLCREVQVFIDEHKTENNSIWMYVNPVKPSKINLRPEYSAELMVTDKTEKVIMTLYSRMW